MIDLKSYEQQEQVLALLRLLAFGNREIEAPFQLENTCFLTRSQMSLFAIAHFCLNPYLDPNSKEVISNNSIVDQSNPKEANAEPI